MSHPQPTPQDDDQTPIAILTRHVRNPWGQHDGWWECMCTAVHNAQHVLDELKTAGYELVNQVGTTTPEFVVHEEVESCQEAGKTFTAGLEELSDELRGVLGRAVWRCNRDAARRGESPTLHSTAEEIWHALKDSGFSVVKLPTPALKDVKEARRLLVGVKGLLGDNHPTCNLLTVAINDAYEVERFFELEAATKSTHQDDDKPLVPTLIESIAQWLGERESTHLWPEIHESDKACYRDAARHLVATVGRWQFCEPITKGAFKARESIAPGASVAAKMGRQIAERNIAASQEAGNGFAAALEATGILHGLPGLTDDLIRLVAELAPKPWKLTDVEGVANLVAVQLPEPDDTGNWGKPATDGWNVVALDDDQPSVVVWTVGGKYAPGQARNLAAALLAAAAKAEASE